MRGYITPASRTRSRGRLEERATVLPFLLVIIESSGLHFQGLVPLAGREMVVLILMGLAAVGIRLPLLTVNTVPVRSSKSPDSRVRSVLRWL